MSTQPARRQLSPGEAARLRVNLARAALFAALLGLAMEGLLVLGGASTLGLAGLRDHSLWPFMVCIAVSVGQAVGGGLPARSGLIGLVATPVAFVLAKVLQKGMAVMVDGTSAGDLVTPALLAEAGLRAVEYGLLAAGLAWLVWRPWGGVLAHIGYGLALGVVFGLIITLALPPDEDSSVVGWVVRELLFPAGCALVIFASETLTKLLPDEGQPVGAG